MRKTLRYQHLFLGVLFASLICGGLFAEDEHPQQSTTPPKPSAAPAPVASKSAQDKQRDEVRAMLDGTTWTIDLRSDATGKTKQDTLTFQGRTVSSGWLTKSGYGASNYSLRIQDDGLVIWETMQSKEGEGLAFWRGELQNDAMSGALSKQPTKGASESFSFSGKKAGAATPTVESKVEPKPAAAPAPAPVAAPAPQPEKKKKKRGLF